LSAVPTIEKAQKLAPTTELELQAAPTATNEMAVLGFLES